MNIRENIWIDVPIFSVMSFHFPRYWLDENRTSTLAYRWPTASTFGPFPSLYFDHIHIPPIPCSPLQNPRSVSIMWRLKIIGNVCDLYLFCLAKTFTNEAKFYFWVGAHTSVSVSVAVSLVYLPDIWRTLLLSGAELFAGKKRKENTSPGVYF